MDFELIGVAAAGNLAYKQAVAHGFVWLSVVSCLRPLGVGVEGEGADDRWLAFTLVIAEDRERIGSE